MMNNRGQIADDSHMIPLVLSFITSYVVLTVLFGHSKHVALAAWIFGVATVVVLAIKTDWVWVDVR